MNYVHTFVKKIKNYIKDYIFINLHTRIKGPSFSYEMEKIS